MTPGSALLVGGSSEIGMAVLLRLLGPAPRRVVLAGRPSDELWRNAERLRTVGYSVSTTEYDAGLTVEEIDGRLDHLAAEDPLDLVIVAVGSLASKSFAEGVVVNGLGVSLLLRALVHRGTEQIVLLSSAAAVRPRQAIAAYSLGKQLADSTARLLARQTAETGVRVLVVRPGFVSTRMTAGLPVPALSTSPEHVARRVASAVDGRRTVVWVPWILGIAVRVLNLVPRRLLPVDLR
ncbi:decaprenylphospho-beta-D-erythro-pentofuranosid-2-ulose 2-reductase [Kribbella amoyensis]|uniref:Decaprenylphospho-beta-D-erythro-pentofuranosid-2-ulose 2-reductase n=1 Tax=Kribbella amoyensis TaxID=996641 RepID=A0A561C0K2_9ACTN|nr:SDR family NAD(P)-dependent oxidoreductase [Kribbella amoyensis]TWD84610.1 decaprenylphospho-beta-D-erythro-pentofuranosid-2-ulose 2-reductase [Kribbella amoyensis]